MTRSIKYVVSGVLCLFLLFEFLKIEVLAGQDADPAVSHNPQNYTGSQSCRKCHEKFYQLWAPSHHGLAMQPFTPEFGRDNLIPHETEMVIGDLKYRFEVIDGEGWVVERGPQEMKKFRIDHVMGGKNVYYFLTSMDRGRLQTLPLGYDVNRKEWFDVAASGVRHLPGQTSQPTNWKDWQYTFNTSCYGCHVSQVSTNYDSRTDTYNTVWKEPGINCEACHGPAQDHIKVCESAPKGTIPKDLKIIRGGRDFSVEQNNGACSSCHAKSVVITETFQPGAKFFDHFGLVTLESPDYYPDGRDLGENYSYTSWLMSPCVKSGKLDCLHCHTSSGRYKFKTSDNPNQACMPCHNEKVDNPTEHTMHKPDSPGNKCVACHMPTTEFARMRRSDHSMRPPAPAATIEFNSPNACNVCHEDKDPKWADEWVRKWRKRDYQAAEISRGKLIESGRKRDWSRLDDMIDYVTSPNRDEIVATSLIRLMTPSADPGFARTLLTLVKDSSPLVRSAAVTALQNYPSRGAMSAIVEATGDEYRLVRVSAAAAMSGYSNTPLSPGDKKKVEMANKEYLDSILSRPDQWDSHYNLGNYYLDREVYTEAVSSYEKALKLEPRAILAMVNEAMAYAGMGDRPRAAASLEKALKIAPDNAVANLNLALLQAEDGNLEGAEKHLRKALDSDPLMGQAAFNLCVILSKGRLDEALQFCQKAAQAAPNIPKYAFTLAYYLQQKGQFAQAADILEKLIDRFPNYSDAYTLAGEIYKKQGKRAEAIRTYKKAIENSTKP